MKPASILLLAAAGLSSALPAQSFDTHTGVQQARDTRSLFGHAINAIAARNLVPLNSNTAAPPPAAAPAPPPPAADPAAGKKEAPTPTDKKAGDAKATDAKAGDAKAGDAKAGDAKATDAAATTAAAATTVAATDAAATEAATTTAAPAIETGAVAVGNGTAPDNGKGKGKGNGKDNGKGKGAGQGKGNGNGQGKHGNKNNNNNGNGALSAAIAGALKTLGLDGVLDASSLDKLNVGDQISLLAQIVSLQTMKDLQMVGGQDIVVVLNQGFKSNGLNVIINA